MTGWANFFGSQWFHIGSHLLPSVQKLFLYVCDGTTCFVINLYSMEWFDENWMRSLWVLKKPFAGYRRFAICLRDEKSMQDTKNLWGKNGHARDNEKINYTRFAILVQLFYPIPRENHFVSCILTVSTARQFETQEIFLMKQHKKYEITPCRVLHVFCVLRMSCELSVTGKLVRTVKCEKRNMYNKSLYKNYIYTLIVSCVSSEFLCELGFCFRMATWLLWHNGVPNFFLWGSDVEEADFLRSGSCRSEFFEIWIFDWSLTEFKKLEFF